jgi:hypothetical protein
MFEVIKDNQSRIVLQVLSDRVQQPSTRHVTNTHRRSQRRDQLARGAQTITTHKPHTPRPLTQHPGSDAQRKMRFADTPEPGQGDDPMIVQRLLRLGPNGDATNKLTPSRGQVRRASLQRSRRREGGRPSVRMHTQVKQPQRLGKVFEAMQPEILDIDLGSQRRKHVHRQKDLPAVRCRADPRGAMNLNTGQPAVVAMHHAHVNPHPHAQLANNRRPLIRAQRPLTSRRRGNRIVRAPERRKERIALRVLHLTTRRDDRGDEQTSVFTKHRRPVGSQRASQLCRALDIGEQHRQDLPRYRTLGHRHLSSRSLAGCQTPGPPALDSDESVLATARFGSRHRSNRPLAAPDGWQTPAPTQWQPPASNRHRSRRHEHDPTWHDLAIRRHTSVGLPRRTHGSAQKKWSRRPLRIADIA